MLRYSLSLGYFFTNVPLTQRFRRARDAGFDAVEFFWPTDESFDEIAVAVREAGVEVVLFNAEEGDYRAGDRGYAGVPERRDEWRASMRRALDLAGVVGCSRINTLTGVAPADRREEYLDCVVANLTWAAPLAAQRGVQLLLEPLNAVTHPMYLCQRTSDALALMARINEPNVLLQYDVYQAQRGEGDVVNTIRRVVDRIAHVQIGDSPDRGAPGTGELNYPYILRQLDAAGYAGHVGLEYNPGPDPFGWMASV